MTIHPLDDVRGLQEEHKSPWPTIVREHLNRTLVKTGYVSAEDFDALGIPPEHSNLANAQMGAYSRMGYMEAISWHRSKKPSRKSGKVWTHKITEKGRQELSKLAGVGTDGGCEAERPEDHDDWIKRDGLDFCSACQSAGKDDSPRAA